jgi:hypothetical protein
MIREYLGGAQQIGWRISYAPIRSRQCSKRCWLRHPTLRHDLLLIEDGGPKSADAARLVGSAKGARFY